MKRAAVATALAAFSVCIALSCADKALAEPCTGIPVGGCPLSHGVACDDPTCAAAYACLDNEWVLDHTCLARDASTADVVDASFEDVVEASVIDAATDAPPGAYGGPGCVPLESPDCALGIALACPSGCCACEDLFTCTTNGGWTPYGRCRDGIISSP